MIQPTQAWLVFCKEAKETLRDRRTLVAMIGVPVLLYPLLAIGTTQLVQMQMASLRTQKVRVAFLGERQQLAQLTAQDGLLGALARDGRLEVRGGPDAPVGPDGEQLPPPERKDTDGGRADEPSWGPGGLDLPPLAVDDALERIRAGELDVAIAVGPGPPGADGKPGPLQVVVHFTITQDQSSTAASRVIDMLRRVYLGSARDRLSAQDPDLTFAKLAPMSIEMRNADPQHRAGFVFGRMMALLLVILAVSFPFHPALDLAAGEKERGTLETLLVSPAGRREIVLGKYLACLAIGMLGATLNLASMALTFGQFANMSTQMVSMRHTIEAAERQADEALGPEFFIQASQQAPQFEGFGLSVLAVGKILLALVPLVALFAAIALALSSLARSYKEGQHYLTPLLVVVMPLSMVSMIPNISLNYASAWVPVVNVVLLVRDLFIDKLLLGPFLVAVGSTAIFAGIALWITVLLFEREEVLFREVGSKSGSLRPREPQDVLPVGGAIVGACLALITAHLIGPQLGAKLAAAKVPMLGIVAAGQALFLALTAALLWWYRARLATSLALHRVSPLALLGTVVMGLGAALLTFVLLPAIIRQFPQFEEQMRKASELFGHLFAQQDLLAKLAVMALMPAVIEELLCRGALLQSLRRATGPTAALVISAAIFGLLHSPFVRVPTTFLLGLLVGWTVLRSGSLTCGIALHLVWNGSMISAEHLAKGLDEAQQAQVEQWSWICWPLGLALLAVGAVTFIAATRVDQPPADAPGAESGETPD